MDKSQIDYSSFVFCPKCGARRLRPQPPYAYHCDACGFTFYMNIASATAAVIIDDQNRLLVAIRGNEPAKGTFDLPGGFVDLNETGEEAIRREVREELNLDVTEMIYLFSVPNDYPYGGVLYHTLDQVFRCQVKDLAGLKAADDVAAVQWIPICQLEPEKFGLKSIREIIRRLKTFA